MGSLASTWLRRLALPTAIAVSAISTIALLYWFITNDDIAMDFSVYWRVANDPVVEAYRPRPGLNFPYAPTMLLWTAPLSLTPFWPAYAIWLGVSVFAFVWVCRAHLTTGEIALALGSFPMAYCLLNGQVSAFLTALLIWACGSTKRVAAGVVLAVIASVKPQLVLMAPLLLLARKDWQAIGSSMLAFVAIVAVSFVTFGFETWEAWLRSLGHFQEIVVRNGVLPVTITPASVAQMRGLEPTSFMIGGAAIGAWLVMRCKDSAPLHRATAIAAGSLLASPYAMVYDLVATVPFLAWSIFRGSLLSAFMILGAFNPVPLLATAFAVGRRPSGKATEPIGQPAILAN